MFWVLFWLVVLLTTAFVSDGASRLRAEKTHGVAEGAGTRRVPAPVHTAAPLLPEESASSSRVDEATQPARPTDTRPTRDPKDESPGQPRTKVPQAEPPAQTAEDAALTEEAERLQGEVSDLLAGHVDLDTEFWGTYLKDKDDLRSRVATLRRFHAKGTALKSPLILRQFYLLWDLVRWANRAIRAKEITTAEAQKWGKGLLSATDALYRNAPSEAASLLKPMKAKALSFKGATKFTRRPR